MRWDEAVPDDLRTLLLDPQTSGGLLAAVPAHEASSASAALAAVGYAAAVIGEVIEPGGPAVVVEVAP